MEKVSNINNLNLKTPDLYTRIIELEAQLLELRQRLPGNSTPIIIIEKLEKLDVCIRRVAVDKLEFNLDDINVDDLSGMLSIGINTDGKVKK